MLYLKSKMMEWGTPIRGWSAVKVHHLSERWPESGSFTEKHANFFGDFLPAIWASNESSWNEGSKNTHGGYRKWSEDEIWLLNHDKAWVHPLQRRHVIAQKVGWLCFGNVWGGWCGACRSWVTRGGRMVKGYIERKKEERKKKKVAVAVVVGEAQCGDCWGSLEEERERA